MELEPKPQEPELFALAELEPDCIPDPFPNPDLDLDPTKMERRKIVKKVKKKKKLDYKFWATMLLDLLLILNRQDFVQNFYLKNGAKYGLEPDLDLDQEADPEPKLFLSRNRNRNK